MATIVTRAEGDLAPAYDAVCYWERRFAREADFEWYGGLAEMSEALGHLSHGGRVLESGCGSSSLAEAMVSNGGFEDVVAFDFSETCIAAKRARLAASFAAASSSSPASSSPSELRGRLAYECCDARALPFADASATGGVVDKATLDAVDCGDIAVAPTDGACSADGDGNGVGSLAAGSPSRAVAAEYARVLAPGAALAVVSSRPARRRLASFEGLPLTLELAAPLPERAAEVGRPGGPWVYVLRKRAAAIAATGSGDGAGDDGALDISALAAWEETAERRAADAACARAASVGAWPADAAPVPDMDFSLLGLDGAGDY